MASATDDFDRADENPLDDGVWAEHDDHQAIKIDTNEARSDGTSGQNASAIYDGVSFDDDQFAEADWIISGSNSRQCGIWLRAGGATNWSGYIIAFGSASGDCKFYDYDGASFNQLGAGETISEVSGQITRGEAEGTTLRMIYNSSEISTRTDSTYTGGQTGLRLRHNGGNDETLFDNFSAGDLAAVDHALAANSDGVGTMVADLFIDHALAANMDGVGAMVATLQMTILFDLTVMTGLGTMTPDLRRELFLDAQADGVGTMVADGFITIEPLDAQSDGVGTMSADLFIDHALAASMDGVGTMVADLTRQFFIATNMDGVGTMSADLIIDHDLTANMDGVGTMLAEFTKQLAAVMDGVGTMSADLFIDHPLAISSDGVGVLVPDLFVDHELSASMDGVGTMVADASMDRSPSANMDGMGGMSADLFVTRKLDVVMDGVGGLTGALLIDFLMTVEMGGVAMMAADLAITPGGAGETFDSIDVKAANSEVASQTSSFSMPLHGQFVIPAGFTKNDRVRIAVIPAAHQLVSVTLDYDALGMGSVGTMQVGTATQQSAFIANVDILVEGLALMSAPNSSVRPTRDAPVFVELTFTGDLAFNPGARIRFAAEAVYMPVWRE